jgi:hypothetical protein
MPAVTQTLFDAACVTDETLLATFAAFVASMAPRQVAWKIACGPGSNAPSKGTLRSLIENANTANAGGPFIEIRISLPPGTDLSV